MSFRTYKKGFFGFLICPNLADRRFV